MKMPRDMLNRWKRLVMSLEEQSQQMQDASAYVDWSDISVLDAYLSDDWDVEMRGPNPDDDVDYHFVVGHNLLDPNMPRLDFSDPFTQDVIALLEKYNVIRSA